MKKNLFISMIVLMSIALVGIIFTQMHIISRAFQEKEDQFRLNAGQVVKTVADKVQQKELKEFVDIMVDSTKKSKFKTISGMRIMHFDEDTKEDFLYSNDVIEQDFGKSKRYDVNIKKLISKRIFSTKNKSEKVEKQGNTRSEYLFKKVGRINEIDKALFYTSYKDVADKISLENRVSKETLQSILKQELEERHLNINFEYGVYNQDSITSVKSDGFKVLDSKSSFETLLLPNNEGYTPYKLVVIFPNKSSYLMSSILIMSILSGVFTMSIIGVYGYTLYQSIYQRRSSKIKTDFINNMTHEFKTPIATISLALDALNNPKIINKLNIQKKYFKIINEENVRMLSQVEQILNISQFQRRKIKMELKRTKLLPIIESAIDHVKLIVENKKGCVRNHFKNSGTTVNVNKSYFENALVNILDNAIKYSPNELIININVEEDDDDLHIKISDCGSGMSHVIQKRIFEKFFREHAGDVHNIKGHGLGLAFVKYVIDNHKGRVSVESKKNKGSTFCITLPQA